MLIDFHTHVFPDIIAEKTIQILKNKIVDGIGLNIEPETDGTVSSLKENMDRCGVSISINLPIATKPGQLDSIVGFSEKIKSNRMLSFASIHPDNNNKYEMLKEIKHRGFKGIKLHPDYQGSFIDSKENIEILKICEELELYTIIHAGVDIGYRPPYKAMPDRIKNVLEYVSGNYLILAHLGGFMAWDDVEKYLVGKPVYFDTSMTAGFIENDQFKRIILNHGSDKVLFGSDSPWNNPIRIERIIDSFELDKEQLDNIKWRNASRILGLNLT